jgi:hypothetical protein
LKLLIKKYGFIMSIILNSKQSYDCDYSSKSLSEAKESYSFQETVRKIKELADTGKQICLFIGRQAHEPLPVEENCAWVSGDIGFAQAPFPNDRIHLWSDFNEPKNLVDLQRMFHKIVIDQSTCKFLIGDFIANFALLLKQAPDSQMIFEEVPCQLSFPSDAEEVKNCYSSVVVPFRDLVADQKKDKEYFDKYQLENESVRQSDRDQFQKSLNRKERPHEFRNHIIEKMRKENNDIRAEDRALQWAREDSVRHAKEIFNDVDWIKNSAYPYPTDYRSSEDCYIVATGIRGNK